MKSILTLLVVAAAMSAAAQTKISKAIPVKAGQTLNMRFEYPVVKVVSWDKNEILIEAETYRSQLDNKQACIERLESIIKQAMVRPKVRRKKKPSRGMIEKRLESKRRIGEKKKFRRGRLD